MNRHKWQNLINALAIEYSRLIFVEESYYQEYMNDKIDSVELNVYYDRRKRFWEHCLIMFDMCFLDGYIINQKSDYEWSVVKIKTENDLQKHLINFI